MVIIYIRHTHDKLSKYKHDNNITKYGKRQAIKMAKKLIKLYGIPKIIYSSPFQRCIETSRRMLYQIQKRDDETRLIYDSKLSRYFTKLEKLNPSVNPKTLKFNIPIYETKTEFHKRLDKHVKQIRKNKNTVIWCITHAYVYKQIAKRLHVKVPNRIEFLDYFVLKKYWHSYTINSIFN